MDEAKRGQYLPVSLPRRLIADVLHFARKIPSVPVQRNIDVRELVQARKNCPTRPSLVAIFAKAYSLVAAEMPRLRQAYLGFPNSCFYQHPISIASIAIGREYQGEDAVFFVQLRSPDIQPIMDLDHHLRRYKSDPVESVSSFREALRFTKLPTMLRRLAWWYGLNVSGPHRARRFGTFGISTYSSLGADSLHPISPLTTLLNYGPIDDSGRLNLRIIYDHRVLDGAEIAKALIRLEMVLNETIVPELRHLQVPIHSEAA